MTRLGTTQLRQEYGPNCAKAADLVTLTLFGGGRITVAKVAADAFRALNACLVAFNYPAHPGVTGAMNCRPITNGKGLSLHGFGIASDIDWDDNPYGPRLITNMPHGLQDAIKAIRTNSGEYVFRWGGDYAGNKDAMHDEVVCTRRDLASGINPATVPGGYQPPPSSAPNVQNQPGAGFRDGDSGAGVAFLQGMLSIVTDYAHLGDGKPLATDGKFGPRTHARVVEFQQWARGMQQLNGEKDEAKLLKVDAVAGAGTCSAIAFWVGIALKR